MTLDALKEQIEHLPEQQQRDLLRWLDERDRDRWDAEMERDFAPEGPAAFLLEDAKADFEAGRFKPLMRFWRASDPSAVTRRAARLARESVPFVGDVSLLETAGRRYP